MLSPQWLWEYTALLVCSIRKCVRLPVPYSLTLNLFVALFARYAALQSYDTIVCTSSAVYVLFLKNNVVRCNIINDLVACMDTCMPLFLSENSFTSASFFYSFLLAGKG